MSTNPISKWTLTLAAAALGVLAGFALGRSHSPTPAGAPAPRLNPPVDKALAQYAECLADLSLTVTSVAVDEPGAPRREGPGLHVADGQQIRVSARGEADDKEALVLSVDSEGLARSIWPASGISAPCPEGCGALHVAVPASTLPPGPTFIAVYVGPRRFELPSIQDGIRNLGPSFHETKSLPMVFGARAAAGQTVVHGNPPPSP